MRSAMWPLQTAIFQRLSTDEELNARVTGVLDAVSKDQKKPYVTTGDDDVSSFETKTSKGEIINVVLHCWSDYSGKKEAMQILDLMLQAITREPSSYIFNVSAVNAAGESAWSEKFTIRTNKEEA
ncbi:tail completion protein gp17 [Bacillus halotolerans]|uniref:tail completion protein gp17 n=1 Tax=Bacillus halotolerans TaxID=260554 RepID=UPI003EBE86AD